MSSNTTFVGAQNHIEMLEAMMDNTIAPIKNKKKWRKFMTQRGHIKMERADDTKNERWFDEMMKRGYLPAMKAHRDMCGDVFEWDFFDRWVEKKMEEAGIAPDHKENDLAQPLPKKE